MKNIFPIWWIICVFLALAHQILEKLLNIHIVFIDSYLDPFLFMPIVLHLISLERKSILRMPDYTLGYIEILIILLLVCFISEIVFPYYKPEFIADIYDVCSYFIGTLLFLIVTRKYKMKWN